MPRLAAEIVAFTVYDLPCVPCDDRCLILMFSFFPSGFFFLPVFHWQSLRSLRVRSLAKPTVLPRFYTPAAPTL